MNLRRALLSVLLLALAAWSGIAFAQAFDWNKYSGLDGVYDMSVKAATPAPKGYKAVYISHYGRHGSRYAYTAKAYTLPLELLRAGASKGNLTDRGFKLLSELEKFYEKAQSQVGDLTPLGWQQHDWIARTMVASFPDAFKKGSEVDACSSTSVRSIMSMSSECAAIAAEAPKADVYAHSGSLDIQATRPNMGKNPFAYKGPKPVFPYDESSEAFFLRKFPNYNDALARLFKNTAGCLGKCSAYDFFFHYTMLVVGMNSLPEDVRVDISGLLTDEELAILWEIDNYERFREYLPYCVTCSSIVDDMIAKADDRLSAGSTGANLRFGHDHVLMSLLMIMDIEGFGQFPAKADDLKDVFRTYCSPMAANIQFVFYTPKCKKHGGEPLVKLLLNGEEAVLGNLKPFEGPYYEWPAVKEYLSKRTSLFVNRL